jgi:hypothetical protein
MQPENCNAVLIGKIDREDYWVMPGFIFRCNNTKFYAEALNEIESKFTAPEFIQKLIDAAYLRDQFEEFEDPVFHFKGWSFCGSLYFVFENMNGDEFKYRMSVDFVEIVD